LRLLLDTHVVIRWLSDIKRLSREQIRAIRQAERRGEPVALCAVTLVEVVTCLNERRHRLDANIEDIFEQLEENPLFRILPITIPIAAETRHLSILRDPADRTIVATARMHRLRLLTSDQRIIASKLVSFID